MNEQEKYLKEIRDELKAIREHMDYFSSMAKKEITEREESEEYIYSKDVMKRIKNECIRFIPATIFILVVLFGISVFNKIS